MFVLKNFAIYLSWQAMFIYCISSVCKTQPFIIIQMLRHEVWLRKAAWFCLIAGMLQKDRTVLLPTMCVKDWDDSRPDFPCRAVADNLVVRKSIVTNYLACVIKANTDQREYTFATLTNPLRKSSVYLLLIRIVPHVFQ